MAYEVLVVLFTASALAVLAYVGLQGRFTDLYLRARGPAEQTSAEVVVVTVGREALYLWDPADPEPEVTPRGLLAALVEAATAAEAEVVVLDFLLDRPAEGDADLAAAMGAHPRVVTAERFESEARGREFVPGTLPALGAVSSAGFANLQAEAPTLLSDDLLVRSAPLVRRVARAELQGTFPMGLLSGIQEDDRVWPSMALVAAWWARHPGESPDSLLSALDAACPALPGPCDGPGGDLGLPELPGDLSQALTINYRGPEGATGIPEVSGALLLRAAGTAKALEQLGAPSGLQLPDEVAALLKGRVVVIGRTDARSDEAHDRFVTPYAFPLPMRADMEGVRIQAQLIDVLLAGTHVRTVGRPWSWLLALLLGVGVVGSQRVLREDLHAVLWTAVGLGLAGVGVVLFGLTDGLALQLDLPLAALTGSLLVVTVLDWAVADNEGEYDPPEEE